MDLATLGPHTRRLAAILFTDMVGYTAIMQRDELLAIAVQKRHQAVVDQYVSQYGGQVKNDTGDGSMNILPSAIQAIQCAMAIQNELKNEPTVYIRVGIHIADVIEEENGKIHGDGINIASRIETLGVAGAILFSKEVYNKIKNHPEFIIQSVGSFPFKNVEEPMDIYAIANKGFSVPSQEQAFSTGKLKKENKTTQKQSRVPTNSSPLKVGLLLAASIFFGLVLWKVISDKPSSPRLEPIENKVQPALKEVYTGKVLDYKSQTVPGVIILINDGVGRDTSDAMGNYSLELPQELKDKPVDISLYYQGKLNHSVRINLTHDIKELKLVPEEK